MSEKPGLIQRAFIAFTTVTYWVIFTLIMVALGCWHGRYGDSATASENFNAAIFSIGVASIIGAVNRRTRP